MYRNPEKVKWLIAAAGVVEVMHHGEDKQATPCAAEEPVAPNPAASCDFAQKRTTDRKTRADPKPDNPKPPAYNYLPLHHDYHLARPLQLSRRHGPGPQHAGGAPGIS